MRSTLPDSAARKIREKVSRDLAPRSLVVHFKLFLAVTVGGLVSLTICGQFGMGVTGWAETLSHSLHEKMPPLLCAAICGTLYAIFPTLILRLFLCSPMQFRVILNRRILDLGLWYGSAGIGLSNYGRHGQGAVEILFWFLSALLTSYMLAMILKSLFPLWSFTEMWRHEQP